MGRRLATAHLSLEDDRISRIHAVVEVSPEGAVSIIDMGSAEGGGGEQQLSQGTVAGVMNKNLNGIFNATRRTVDSRADFSYNGAFNSQPKTWGNPRHSYRCVREP